MTTESRQRIVRDYASLEEAVREGVQDGSRVVAIDGFPGAGKSTAAAASSVTLGAAHIQADDFLERNRGGYLTFIRYHELQIAILRKLDSHLRVLVDGVCVKAVLDQMRIVDDLHVYVKRVGLYNHWANGSDLQGATFEEAFSREEKVYGPADDMTRDVLRYH